MIPQVTPLYLLFGQKRQGGTITDWEHLVAQVVGWEPPPLPAQLGASRVQEYRPVVIMIGTNGGPDDLAAVTLPPYDNVKGRVHRYFTDLKTAHLHAGRSSDGSLDQ